MLGGTSVVLPTSFYIFFSAQLLALLVGEKLASFDGLNLHANPALAKAPAKELSAYLPKGCCGCTPASAIGGGYDKVGCFFYVFHYYNIPPKHPPVKGWRYDC